MKIALIAVKQNIPEWTISKHPSLGLLSIASYLLSKKVVKRNEIKIFDTSVDNPLLDLEFFNPDVIAFSTITPFYLLAKSYAKKISKKFKKAKIIIGGFHISSAPESLEKPFAIGVVGEGEQTFAKLIELFKKNKNPSERDLIKIKSIVFLNKNNHVVKTPKRSLIYPLDKLPHIDWSLLPKDKIGINDRLFYNSIPIVCKTAYIYSSRGCPYNCFFCAYNTVWGKKLVRYFSTKYFVEEVELLYKKYKIKGFRILDDTFSLNKKRIRKIISSLKEKKLLKKIYFYQVFVRADNLNKEMCYLLKKLRVVSVFIGMESGSQKILNLLKSETLTISQIKKAVILLNTVNISVIGSFMLFNPEENMNDIQKTLNLMKWLAKQNNALDITIYVTTPYPGTALWKKALDEKIININSGIWKKVEFTEFNKIPRIFFKNRLKLKECQQIWLEANRISAKVATRWNKKTLVYNIKKRMEKRFIKLKKEHIFLLLKIIKKPYKIFNLFKDVYYALK